MIINRSFPSSLSNKERFCSLKSLVLLVVIAILATSNSYAQASFESIDGLRYLIDSDAKTATLTANVGEKYSGDIVVPEKVKASDGVEYPVTAFGDNAFDNCRELNSITIPSSVTSLGKGCFSSCWGLTTITIPSSITSLSENCFNNCKSLTSITLPLYLEDLSYYCFTQCENLKEVKCLAMVPPTGSQLSLPTGCKIYVPKSVLDSYKTSSTWQDFPIFALDNSGTGVAQCEIPTINYDNGTIKVFSATPNSVCHYSISCDDVTTNNITYDGNIYLSAAYNISAYVTADGYMPSDKATATLYWVEANLQNTTTNINQTATRGIIVTSNDGIVTLSGLNNDETVRFYTVDGKQLGAAKAVNGAASQAVSESVVIAKMGNQTIKIVVK